MGYGPVVNGKQKPITPFELDLHWEPKTTKEIY